MKEFIGTTVGLECNGHGQVGNMIAVQFIRTAAGIVLQPVSGRNLAHVAGTRTVTHEEFDNRPSDNIGAARWALNRCGWTLMHDDA